MNKCTLIGRVVRLERSVSLAGEADDDVFVAGCDATPINSVTLRNIRSAPYFGPIRGNPSKEVGVALSSTDEYRIAIGPRDRVRTRR
jgi:hypothetical protein